MEVEITAATSKPERCAWVPAGDPLYEEYHDREWGVPVHDDRRMFELLCLEGAQAGLSWRTILARRDGYRGVFEDFDAEKLAEFDGDRLEARLTDRRIVRNRLKVFSVRDNARALLRLQAGGGSLTGLMWGVVGNETIVNRWQTLSEVPAVTPEAEAMSRLLKARGFRFVGPTICYAHMQSAGLVNDHLISCFRYRDLAG
jgi:DNA-3-methyladenine glycosylase I